jgi:hypothetical protein
MESFASVTERNSRRTWPWNEPGAVFSPASDVLGWDWKVEINALCAAPSGVASDPGDGRAGAKSSHRVILRASDPRDSGVPARRLRLIYGPGGTLLEFADHDHAHPYLLKYRYDDEGRLIQERLIQSRHDTTTSRTASRSFAATGELAAVEVRDGSGSLLEVHSFLAEGRMTCRRGLGPNGRIWFEETTECLADGRPGERRRIVFDPLTPTTTRSERVETWDYASDHARPIRWRIVERDHEGRRAAIEEVHYDPGSGLPIEDDTRYYELDTSGRLRECFRLLLRRPHAQSESLEVIEEDILQGRVKLRRLASDRA